MLNDRHLVLRCRVNEAYNYVHAGNFGVALSILREVIALGKFDGDTLLLAVARSARLFCKRVRRASEKFELGMEGENVEGDELYRIRTGVRAGEHIRVV